MRNDPFHCCAKAAGLEKCQDCINGIDQWEGYKVCKYAFSPKRCGEHYKMEKETALFNANQAFKGGV